jgi:hypothetical protein
METFAPLINLITLLAGLSLVAERVTNAVKLHRKELREKATKGKEKEREKRITAHALFLSFAVALVVNANFFEILTHLEAPWETLGWAQLQAGQLVQTSSALGVGKVAYTTAGCMLTGFAMGFGSTFWHDLLGVVLDTRNKLKQMAGG